MEITAKALYMRISPKKMKALAHTVVGLDPKDAVTRLLLLAGKKEAILAKVIKGAIANATNNLKLDAQTLTISSVTLGKGPAFKRFQPVARGMAHSYKKRTSHITVVLKQKENKGDKVVLKQAEKVEKVEKVEGKEKEKTKK